MVFLIILLVMWIDKLIGTFLNNLFEIKFNISLKTEEEITTALENLTRYFQQSCTLVIPREENNDFHM